jgi:hypothetical protein
MNLTWDTSPVSPYLIRLLREDREIGCVKMGLRGWVGGLTTPNPFGGPPYYKSVTDYFWTLSKAQEALLKVVATKS